MARAESVATPTAGAGRSRSEGRADNGAAEQAKVVAERRAVALADTSKRRGHVRRDRRFRGCQESEVRPTSVKTLGMKWADAR